MQLTKLEVKGFKSFKDKTIIHFNEGITGIVGPNGCGKSNVIDAIRWVLGEQKSSSLRSEKMGNIIFNGSKKHKASQLAEATLTFSNNKNILPTEYSTVCISRRYYRTGESEYLLNSVPCRLKDITNLFMDTGINANSYAIIELKMIDELLNDKENSRRTLFEEAAGISKYRSRKKDTLKKIKDTDDDLIRIEDLLSEIKKNMKGMERQAKQAERYFNIKTEYKKNSTLLAKKQFVKYLEQRQNMDIEIAEEQKKYSSLASQLAESEVIINQKKNELLSNEQTLSSRQKTLNKQSGKIHDLENNNKLKLQKLTFLENSKDNLANSLEQNNAKLEELKLEKNNQESQLENLKKILLEDELKKNKALSDLEDSKSQGEITTKKLNAIREEFKIVQTRVFESEKIESLTLQKLETLRTEIKNTDTETKTYTENKNRLDAELSNFQKLLGDKEESLNRLLEKNIRTESVIEAKTKQIVENSTPILNTKQELSAKESELKITTHIHEKMEGYPKAIQFLTKNKAWRKDKPLLSEIIDCKPEYLKPISIALKPYLNHFVVKTEDEALDAIARLDKEKMGIASFFILDKVKETQEIDTKKNTSEDLLINRLETNPEFKKLINYLIGNTIISSEKPKSQTTKHISKDAKLFHENVCISGGFSTENKLESIGILNRLSSLQLETEKLKETILDLEEEENILKEELIALKENSETEKKEIIETQKSSHKLEQEKLILETKLQHLVSNQKEKETELNTQKENINHLEKELKKLEPETKDLKYRLEHITDQELEIEEVVLEWENKLERKRGTYNEINLDYHRKENKIISLKDQVDYLRKKEKEASDEISAESKKLEHVKTQIENHDKNSSNFDEDIYQLKQELENIRNGVKEAEKDYFRERAIINDVENHLNQDRKNKDRISELLHLLETKKNEIKLTIHQVKESVKLEFSLELHEANSHQLKEETESVNEELFTKNIENFKREIEKLGVVNPMALEAFQEIKDRFDFISTEKEDLTRAKDILMETIEEIDAIAKEKFMDSFTKIKINFVKVFRSLFSEEDTCNLKLTDPSNPLQSKIEIMAQPKGKRPLSINQLSGGEKTLTATALLFAIYLLKPAPFCIFDEVDAPLDDANIDKFNKIIHKFSDESQFIIVTHNKRTMASTDIMYGVTMIEQGVSKLIPVNLKEFNNKAS